MRVPAPLVSAFILTSSLSMFLILAPSGNSESLWHISSASDFNGAGRYYNDTILAGTGDDACITLARAGDWIKQDPLYCPKLEYNFDIASVGDKGNVLLFGDSTQSGPLNYTWIFDPSANTWIMVGASNPPPGRYSFALATIWNDDRVLLFGGCDIYSRPMDDTWIYDLSDNRWTQLTCATHPSARYGHEMASTPGLASIVLFGGGSSDLWVFDTGQYTWYRKSPTGGPPSGRYPCLAPVWNDDRFVLFGGSNGNDTWVYDLGSNFWSLKLPETPPPRYWSYDLASIPGDDKVVLYCGYDGTTWTYDLGQNCWRHRQTLGHPPSGTEISLAVTLPAGNVLLISSDGQTFLFDPTAYVKYGSYTSPCHDARVVCRPLNITWQADVPPNCTLGFQVRTGSSYNALHSAKFTGPDGTAGSLFYGDFHEMPNQPANRWFQYLAILQTLDPKATPSVREVHVTYNHFPEAPLPTFPEDWAWTNASHPVFSWTFRDADSGQAGFEWQMGNESEIFPPVYSSGEQESGNCSFTSLDSLPEGGWLWRVRTKDTDGDWSPFSAWQWLGVDLTKPADFMPECSPADWSRGPFRASFLSNDSLSSLAGYRVYLDGQDLGLQESPYRLPELKDGMHRLAVRAYDHAGNYAEGWTRVLVDRTPPEPFSPAVIPPGWTTLPPEISFTATDNASGIDHYEASICGMPFSRQSSPFVLPELSTGANNITVRAYDRAGNFRDATVFALIDNLPPTEVLGTFEPAGWTSQDPLLRVNVGDPGSGFWRVEVMVGDQVYSSEEPTVRVPGLPEGLVDVPFRVYDRVGYFADSNALAYIDRTPPLPFKPVASPAGWHRGLTTILYKASDNLSGVARYELSADGGPFKATEWRDSMFDLADGEHRITVRAYDAAGNYIEGNVTAYIDSRPPVNVSISINGGAASTADRAVRLAINASDLTSGPSEMSLSNDGASYSPWEPFRPTRNWTLDPGGGEKQIFLWVRDRAGNEANIAFASIEYSPVEGPGPWLPLSASAILLAAFVAAALGLRRRARRRRAGGGPPDQQNI